MSCNTRKISTDIIYNVLIKSQLLSKEFSKCRKTYNELSALDMRFINEIVNGTLRNLEYIDFFISNASEVKFKKISPYVLSILRVGAYQILFMDKVPVSAAVNESVKIAKKSSNYKLSGFVNAVLRKIDLNRNVPLKFNDETERLSVIYSCPKWLVSKLSVESDNIEALLKSMQEKPKTILRVNTLKTTCDKLIDSLNNRGWSCEKYTSSVFPDIDYLISANKIEDIESAPEYIDGHFYIQDSAASYVGEVLNPKPQSVVLDMCASPGGKTTHFAEIMKDTGTVYAFDVSEDKINVISENSNRLGLKSVKAFVRDSSVFDEKLCEIADYVLVDAPCSGIGIIRKKPDIKYSRKENDIKELARISFNILNTASKYLKKGGTMVFSTCTIFKEENEDVLYEFLKQNPEFKLKTIPCTVKNNGYITFYPHIHDCDGFFISLLTKGK